MAFKNSVQRFDRFFESIVLNLKLMEKQRSFLKTPHEIIFVSESNEVLVFTKKKCPVGTPSSENPTKIFNR